MFHVDKCLVIYGSVEHEMCTEELVSLHTQCPLLLTDFSQSLRSSANINRSTLPIVTLSSYFLTSLPLKYLMSSRW